ncbi:Protein lin-10 [Chionoecetes opilio]|uniref:Protein lin-10 n=1 Tax=Chionoecetes opilio TaxID=41210 RepID=A0A8J4Y3Q6_CHIOP|nr:Protein lin-10 [Chionoecetes opilio]
MVTTGVTETTGWRRPKIRTVMPRPPNHKANRGGATSNGSTPSTPIGQGQPDSPNQEPSTPPDMAASNKTKNKKEKETNKKKGRSKEVMIHEPAVLIEGVLFRARYLGSTQLVSEGQPTKTTRMMQAEEAVSRIKDADDDKEALAESNGPDLLPGPPHSPSPKQSPRSHQSPASHLTSGESDSLKELLSRNSSPQNLNPPVAAMTTSKSLTSPLPHEQARTTTSPSKARDLSHASSEAPAQHGKAWKPGHRVSQGVLTIPYVGDVNLVPHSSIPMVAPLPPGVLEEPIGNAGSHTTPSEVIEMPTNLGGNDEYDDEEGENEDEVEDEECREEQQQIKRTEDEEDEDEDDDDDDDDEEEEEEEDEENEEGGDKHSSMDSEDQCIEVLTVLPSASGGAQRDGSDSLEVDGGGGSLDWVSEEGGGPGLGPAGTVFHLRLVGSVDVADDSGKAPARKTAGKRPKKDMVMEAVAHLKRYTQPTRPEVYPAHPLRGIPSPPAQRYTQPTRSEVYPAHPLRGIPSPPAQRYTQPTRSEVYPAHPPRGIPSPPAQRYTQSTRQRYTQSTPQRYTQPTCSEVYPATRSEVYPATAQRYTQPTCSEVYPPTCSEVYPAHLLRGIPNPPAQRYTQPTCSEVYPAHLLRGIPNPPAQRYTHPPLRGIPSLTAQRYTQPTCSEVYPATRQRYTQPTRQRYTQPTCSEVYPAHPLRGIPNPPPQRIYPAHLLRGIPSPPAQRYTQPTRSEVYPAHPLRGIPSPPAQRYTQPTCPRGIPSPPAQRYTQPTRPEVYPAHLLRGIPSPPLRGIPSPPAQRYTQPTRSEAPDGEAQPSTEVDLFISTEKIMVLNTDLKEIMMDHALRTISYIADIGDLVVLMARRRVLPTDDATNGIQKAPKMICHVFESDEAQFIAQSIGQAFQVAYLEFLKANGIEDHSFVKEMDYQEVLNSQEIFGDELQMFAKKELQKEVVVPKMKSEILGVVVVESGWGSMVPTVVIANLSPTGAAAKCGQLNIGDQIIAINGVSLVGLPLSTCQNYIKKLKDLTCAHEYEVAVSNRFDVLGALEDPVKLWDIFKRETLQAANECIGERPRSRRGFVSTETLEKIEESRAARLAGNRDQHRALSCRTRTLLGRDKERYVRSLAEDVEGHLNANDLRPAYRALKKLRSKSPSRASAIRAADGRLESDMDGQMARWAEYFGQLFTVDPPTEQLHTTGLQAVDADPPIDETAPSLDEVREAVAKLRGGKAAGVCNISAELLKAGGEAMIRGLHAVLTAVWQSSTIPPDWKRGLVVPIWKGKGDRQDCNNYHGITLLSVPGKVLAHLLLTRIRSHLLKHQRPQQSGFTPGKSTTDRILALRVLVEHRREFRQGMLAAYVDLKKAFDSVHLIFAESLEVLVMALEALHEEAKPLGLEVSWLKTKVQVFGDLLDEAVQSVHNTKYNTAVKLTVVPCPPVVEVKIRRPDTKYQLGFSVQNGVICSLLRGGIAERGGVRVGHRIIDINSQSVVAVPHEKIVNLLATSVGEIRMKTMPTSIFRLLTGQETPQYI